MAKLSTSAWILHDLGMAAGFGGTLFGKAALDPAVRGLSSRAERGKVLDDAWRRFNLLDAVALGAVAATWMFGRAAFSGRRLGRPMRNLVLTKDVLVGASLATGIATLVAGRMLGRERRREALPVEAGHEAAPEPPPRARSLEKLLSAMGPINAALIAGAIAVNAALAQEGGKSTRWSFLSRALP